MAGYSRKEGGDGGDRGLEGIWKSTLGRGCPRNGGPAGDPRPLLSASFSCLPSLPPLFPPPPPLRNRHSFFSFSFFPLFFPPQSCACDGWKPGSSVPDQSGAGVAGYASGVRRPRPLAFLIDLVERPVLLPRSFLLPAPPPPLSVSLPPPFQPAVSPRRSHAEPLSTELPPPPPHLPSSDHVLLLCAPSLAPLLR